MMDADASMEDLPIRELYAVPESIPIAKLLQLLQRRHTKIAVVVDEHGGTAGIVTMSDIMEQIVGRVDDEYSHGLADEIVKKGDGRYLIDGSLSIDRSGVICSASFLRKRTNAKRRQAFCSPRSTASPKRGTRCRFPVATRRRRSPWPTWIAIASTRFSCAWSRFPARMLRNSLRVGGGENVIACPLKASSEYPSR